MYKSKVGMFNRQFFSSMIIFFLIIIGLNGLFILPGATVADNEPNDSFATAEIITAGEYHGEINATDMEDYYSCLADKTTCSEGKLQSPAAGECTLDCE